MRSIGRGLVVAMVVLGLPRAWSAGFSLFSSFWGDAVVVTDMTEEGRALTRPMPGKPVYYLGRSLGCKLGSIPGDQQPDERELSRYVAKVLAQQGYLGATPGTHEPTLFLVLQWGYLQPGSGDLLWFLGYNPEQDIGAPAFPGMLGPEVFRRNFRSRTIETVLESASEPIYGIIVTAFDYKSANTPEPIIYWQTRIGLPANGKSMAQALPTMILAGASTIGRETDSPVLRNTDEVREGRVELGERRVLGVVGEDASLEKNPDPAK